MPVRLRNKSPEAVTGPDIPGVVEPNEIADLPKHCQVVSQDGDAYLISTGLTVSQWVEDEQGGPGMRLEDVPEVRAWPKALWSLVSDARTKKDE